MMNFEAVTLQGTASYQTTTASEKVSDARKQKEDQSQSEQVEKKQVQSEELLDQIKSLTDEGLFSVRFEKDNDVGQLVVKIVDEETDEIIRQVPADEILQLRQTLDDLRGNIVDTQG